MKRVFKVVGDDGEVKVSVSVDVLSRNGLMRDEVEHVVVLAADGIMGVLRGLRYTDFPLSKIKVTGIR